MDIIDETKVIIQTVSLHSFILDILRLDLVHPVISGNKWYKLKYNIRAAKEKGATALLTFGGAYSNHLVATAAAAQACGLGSIGIVRGAHIKERLTSTLTACLAMDMKLHYISREEYAKKEDNDWLELLQRQYPNAFIVPEGGANDQGRAGAEEIASLCDGYSHVCCAVGTGTTFIGLRNALPESVQLLGFAPMKEGRYLQELVRPYIHSPGDNWRITDEWHFGGFGKWTFELLKFMNAFYEEQKVPLDIVYTSKMISGVAQLIKSGYFPAGARVLCIHSGGLQGNDSVRGHLRY